MAEAGSPVVGSGVARESRRRKTVWQDWQKEALLSAFSKSSYPSFEERQDLAKRTGIPVARIRVWFQNRRNRTGEVGHAPKCSTRGSSQLASPQLQEELGSGAQGRGMPSSRRRPRTRLTSPQLRILRQAFERNPRPGFATREELARETGLPEDTIHIWFQNQRARRRHSRSRPTAQDQDLLAPQGSDGAPEGPGGREHEGAQESLLPQEEAGSTGMDTSGPSDSDSPSFCTESQPSQVAQPCGAGQEETPTQADNRGPLEVLLDQMLDEVQLEEHAPSPLDLERDPGGREQEGSQDSLVPLDEAANSGMDTSIPSISPACCRDSQLLQVAQPSGPGQAQAPTQGGNTDPLELLLDQLLTEVQVEELGPAPVNVEEAGEQMDTTPELPLTQEEYQTLLDML